MTSTPSPERDPQDAISEDGFFKANDIQLGQRVQELDAEAVQFASWRGLKFCKDNVLLHPRIRPVLKSLFERPRFALYRSLGPSQTVYTFDSALPEESEMDLLIVLLWSKDSRIFFWPRSHQFWLEPIPAANALLEVTRARLRRLGLDSKVQELEDGGFTIHDSRVAFQIEQGNPIVFAFGTKEASDEFNPMRLSKSLQDMVAEMESTGFGMKVIYRDMEGPASSEAQHD